MKQVLEGAGLLHQVGDAVQMTVSTEAAEVELAGRVTEECRVRVAPDSFAAELRSLLAERAVVDRQSQRSESSAGVQGAAQTARLGMTASAAQVRLAVNVNLAVPERSAEVQC